MDPNVNIFNQQIVSMYNIFTEFESAPEMIPKTNILYARAAKVGDMKQLKSSCWDYIKEKSLPTAEDYNALCCSWQIPTTKPVSLESCPKKWPIICQRLWHSIRFFIWPMKEICT
jgi:hypothetical protein